MGSDGALDFAGGTVVHINAGIVGFLGVAYIKPKFGFDDSMDAFGVHGLCGIWGAMATGLFANPSVNEAGRGLFYGNPGQVYLTASATHLFLSFQDQKKPSES